MLDVEIISEIDSLKPLRNEWDSFLESIGGEIYQTYDWLSIWLKYYGKGRKLYIFLFRHEGRLVGVLPLFAENIWLGPVPIRALKVAGSDYMIVSYYPTIEEAFWQEAFAIVAEKLLIQDRYDVLLLGPLSGLFDIKVELLKDSIKQSVPSAIRVNEFMSAEQTYFFVNANYENYLNSLGKKNRHELRRKQKLFGEIAGEDKGLSSRLVAAQEVPQVFEDFYRLHQKHWKSMKLPGHFGAWPNAKEFHMELDERMSETGRLRLLEVRSGNDPVGYKYAFRFGKRLVEYLDARLDDPELERVSIGNLIFLEQAKWACSEGVEIIDSLHGRYEHKARVGGKLLPVKSIMICRPTFRLSLFHSCANLFIILYYKIWLMRVCPRIGFRRGKLWRSYIKIRNFESRKTS